MDAWLLIVRTVAATWTALLELAGAAFFQLTPPPDTGEIDRWVIYTLAAVVVVLFGLVIKQNNDALKKADTRGDKWETTAKTTTDELYEANKTTARAVDTLERQGVMIEALTKDLVTVKADSVELKRVLTGVEQEVRALRESARSGSSRRSSGG